MAKDIAQLKASPMMAHLIDAIDSRTDIGHYGRLAFVIVGRLFLDDNEVVRMISTQPDMGETRARALLLQAASRNYDPPGRDQIIEWQKLQEFPICPNLDSADDCDVYGDLSFPKGVS